LNGLGVLLGPGRGSSLIERGAPDERRCIAGTRQVLASGLLASWDTFDLTCVLGVRGGPRRDRVRRECRRRLHSGWENAVVRFPLQGVAFPRRRRSLV